MFVPITLRAARINKGKTIKQAAKDLGVSYITLFRYENAESFPDVIIVKRMINYYGIPFDEINFFPEGLPQKGKNNKSKGVKKRKEHRRGD